MISYSTVPEPFREKVIRVVQRIPKGQILTYKEVAERAGSPRASRAVGNILNRYGGMDKGIPCHRVIRSDGRIGGYRRGAGAKLKLLRKEKAIF